MEVESFIYIVRGIQVMLDSDLAIYIRSQNVTIEEENKELITNLLQNI